MTRDIRRDLATCLGLARREQLLALGHTAYAVRAAVRRGTVTVPRRGWVAAADSSPRALRAVVLGGRLGGTSALASYGIWVDDDETLVVSCVPTASRLPPTAAGERRVWMAEAFARPSPQRWRVSVGDALLQLAATATREELIASIDSAINLRLLPPDELERLLAALPERLGAVGRHVDGSAMSGTETRMRLMLRAAGYRVECQVALPGIGVVDMVVDGWLILELGSRKHHGDPVQQARDRARDGNAVLSAYGHERFMWSHVRYEPHWCLAVVEQRLVDGPPSRAPLDRSRLLPVVR
jgi:hypothetical protein